MSQEQPTVPYPRASDDRNVARIRSAAEAFQASNQAGLTYLLLVVIYVGAMAVNEPWLFLVMLAVVIVFIVLAVRASILAANTLGNSAVLAAIVTVLLVFVPCGALIILASQQGRLAKVFKEANIKVGLLGPNKAQLEEYLRQA